MTDKQVFKKAAEKYVEREFKFGCCYEFNVLWVVGLIQDPAVVLAKFNNIFKPEQDYIYYWLNPGLCDKQDEMARSLALLFMAEMED